MLENGSFSFKAIALFLSLFLSTASATSARQMFDNNDTPVSVETSSASRYILPLDSITVMGSRLPAFKVPSADLPANISYVPLNASRRDREGFHASHPRSLQESAAELEGVILFDQVGNNIDTNFSLRGFTESSSLIVLVDGVRVNEVDGSIVRYPLISVSDLESLQVDRGSASSIFGSNSFAGVVHVSTGRPSDVPLTLFGGTEISSFDGLNSYAGVKGTLQDKVTPLEGAFGYYFKAGRNINDGFRANGEYRLTDFDIKTEYYLPGEQGRFFLHVKHAHDSIGNPSAITFQQFQDDPTITVKPRDGRDLDMTSVALGGDLKFWDNKIVASLLASARYTNVTFLTTSATFTDGSFNPDTDYVRTKSRSTDLIWQLAYQDQWNDLENQTVIGMEMRDASNQALERDYFEEVFRTTPTETDRLTDTNSVGLYWRESLNYDNRAIIHYGMRHDYEWLETFNNLSNTGIDNRWRDSTLSTGLTVRPVRNVDVFFNYSQGFRVPTISEIAPFSGTISTGLQPEKSDSYEVGTRVRVGNATEFKMSGFLIDLKNEILFDSTSRTMIAPFGQNVNVGRTRRMGMELRVDTQPIQEIKAYASYTWTEAYVRETNATGSLIDGRSLGLVPEDRWTLGFTSHPLQRLGEGWDGVKVGLHGTFTGKQHPQSYESASQTTLNATGGAGHIIKPYSVWDLILSYEHKGLELYFKVNNLFDEKYYSRSVSATSFGTAIQPAGTFSFVNPGAPREFLFGARWEFDFFTDLTPKN